MRLSIENYCDLLSVANDPRYGFEPVTERRILMSGLYANIWSSCVWVTKLVFPNYIQVSNQDIVNYTDNKWSPPLPIMTLPDQIERLFNLKAFW